MRYCVGLRRKRLFIVPNKLHCTNLYKEIWNDSQGLFPYKIFRAAAKKPSANVHKVKCMKRTHSHILMWVISKALTHMRYKNMIRKNKSIRCYIHYHNAPYEYWTYKIRTHQLKNASWEDLIWKNIDFF